MKYALTLFLIAASLLCAAIGGSESSNVPPQGTASFEELFSPKCSYSLPISLTHIRAHAVPSYTDVEGKKQPGALFVYGRPALPGSDSGERIFRFRGCGGKAKDVTRRLLPKGADLDTVGSRRRRHLADDLAVVYSLAQKPLLQRHNAFTLMRRGKPVAIPRPMDQDLPVEVVEPLPNDRWLIGAFREQENGPSQLLHILNPKRPGVFERSFLPLSLAASTQCNFKGLNHFGEFASEVAAHVDRTGRVLAANTWLPSIVSFSSAGELMGSGSEVLPNYMGPPVKECEEWVKDQYRNDVMRSAWRRKWTPVKSMFEVVAEDGEPMLIKGSLQAGGIPSYEFAYDWALEIYDSTEKRVAMTSIHHCEPIASRGQSLYCSDWEPARPWEAATIHEYGLKTVKEAVGRGDPQWFTRRLPGKYLGEVEIALLTDGEVEYLRQHPAENIVHLETLEGCIGKIRDLANGVAASLLQSGQDRRVFWVVLHSENAKPEALLDYAQVFGILHLPMKVRVTNDSRQIDALKAGSINAKLSLKLGVSTSK